MAFNLFLGIFTEGTAANRPATPDTPSTKTPLLYYATDTGVLSTYVNGAWFDIANESGTISTGLTASTTQTLVGALQLTGDYNNVTTVANSGDAVKLPAATLGARVWVTNSGGNPMGVFPQASTDIIDGGSAGAKVTCTNAKSAMFTCIAAGVWQSIGSAARAA